MEALTHLDELDGQSALAHSSSSHHHQFEAFFFSTHLQLKTSPDKTFSARAPAVGEARKKVYTRGEKHARPFVTASNFSCSFSATAGVSAPREDQSPCPWTDGPSARGLLLLCLFGPTLLHTQGGTASSFLQDNSEENQTSRTLTRSVGTVRPQSPAAGCLHALMVVSTRCSLELNCLNSTFVSRCPYLVIWRIYDVTTAHRMSNQLGRPKLHQETNKTENQTLRRWICCLSLFVLASSVKFWVQTASAHSARCNRS